MRKHHSIALLGLLTLFSTATVCTLLDCSPTYPDEATECDGVTIFTISSAGTFTPTGTSGDAAVGPSVIVTGAVSGAPCGVSGVSVMSGVPASSSLPNFATWSATVPLGVLESAGACDAGVNVFGLASIIEMPGVPFGVVDASACVSVLQPSPPGVCSATPTCSRPPDDNGPSGVECQLPVTPGSSAALATLQFYANAEGIGRSVTWKSTTGLSSIVPTSPTVRAASTGDASTGETDSCPVTCTLASNCDGTAAALATGAATATAGVDVITASMDGYVNPVLTAIVSVQGPAKLVPSAAALASGAPLLVAIENPMAFAQTCQVTLPTGTTVSAASLPFMGDAGVDGVPLDAGAFTGTQTCDLPDGDAEAGSTLPCIAQYASTETVRVLALSFSGYITAAEAQAFSLTSAHSITITCEDQFAQTVTLNIPATWGSAPSDAGVASDGGADGATDGGPVDGGSG